MEGASDTEWQQGLNYHLMTHQVGVMNIYVVAGSAIAQLSVFDPVANTADEVRVATGEEVSVGAERYEVVAVVAAREGDGRAYIVVRPVRRRSRVRRWFPNLRPRRRR